MRTTLAAVLALLLAACGGVPDTPEAAFRAYLKAYNAHDCDRLEELVTSDAEVGDDGACTGFERDADLYMIDRVETTLNDQERDDEADLLVLFESGSCRVTMRREDDVWLLHDQSCVGTRVDGELVDLGYR